jgi:uncharacterized protein (TIRG00374 family)
MRKKRLIPALKLAVSVALLAVVYRRVDRATLAEAWTGVRALPLVLFFALLFLNTFISSAKWGLLLRADGVQVPLRNLFGSYLVGTFFNIFLPSNIGGDAYRIYDIAKTSARTSHTVASVFTDRLTGFLALAVLGLVFPVLGAGLVPDRRVALYPLVPFLLIVLAFAVLYQERLVRCFLALRWPAWARPLTRFAGTLMDSLARYKAAPGVMLKAMGISFAFQFTVIVCVYLLAAAMQLGIPFVYFCIFVPLVSLLEAIPVSIYGIGLRDAGYVFFFTRVGRTGEEALAFSILYVAATLAYASLGGVVFVLRNRRAAE